MTQGARTTRSKPDPAIELDLDAWLAKRGLAGEKRMKVGGKWFRFVRSATSTQVVEFSTAQQAADLKGMLTVLLVDPTEIDELTKAFADQKQPLEAKLEEQWLKDIVDFLIAGDVGESSAS